jgi:putative hemolysin
MPTSADLTYADPTDPLLRQVAIRVVERLTGQRRLHRLYRRYEAEPVPGEDVFAAGVRLLGLTVEHDPLGLELLPRTGPLVVVANHPFGLVDGCVLTALIGRVRADYKVVAHGLLARAPAAAERLLPIDFSRSPRAAARNVDVRRQAIAWLRQGHVVIVFPAGGVATTPTPFARTAVDDRWKPFTARLVQAAAAPVLPVRFAGQNSRLFQLASHLSQTLRTALLLHETRNKIGARVTLSIGEAVPFSALAHIHDRQALADHLFAMTQNLPLPTRGRRGRDSSRWFAIDRDEGFSFRQRPVDAAQLK